jgi:hypothetical protein
VLVQFGSDYAEDFIAAIKRSHDKKNANGTYVLGAALLFTLTAPALAEEFRVVQNPTTRKCTIVTENPTRDFTISDATCVSVQEQG